MLPAPRGDKKDVGYCSLHTWKTQLKRQRSMAKHMPPVTSEHLLSNLSHYVKHAKHTSESEDEYTPNATPVINPFEMEVDGSSKSRSYVLECASESDSDIEPSTLDAVWKGANEDSSDAESVDSQMDDPLRHAGIYSAEEVVVITRNKLLRLQCLYQRQFERLGHILKEKRRKYLQNIKKEKELLCSIYDQVNTTSKEQKMYNKLKALNRYHKRSMTETVAYLASIEKRSKEINGTNHKPLGHSAKCTFTEGGVRCQRVTLPMTKHCFKHILEDTSQNIFKACGCEKADLKCNDTVPCVSAGGMCILHIQLPTLPHLNFPEVSPKSEEALAKALEESELDASATESAVSTDNRESPENSLASDALPKPRGMVDDDQETNISNEVTLKENNESIPCEELSQCPSSGIGGNSNSL